MAPEIVDLSLADHIVAAAILDHVQDMTATCALNNRMLTQERNNTSCPERSTELTGLMIYAFMHDGIMRFASTRVPTSPSPEIQSAILSSFPRQSLHE